MKQLFRHKSRTIILFIIMIVVVLLAAYINSSRVGEMLDAIDSDKDVVITLSKPAFESKTSVEKAINQRRSIRDYQNTPLTVDQVSQLLWSMQGITNRQGFRTAPSAGVLYPLEIYALILNVTGLKKGIYHYSPKTNTIRLISNHEDLKKLSDSTNNQAFIFKAPVVFVIAADYSKSVAKFGVEGKKYVHMEAGHVAQNLYLQSVSLGLGTISIGAIKGNLNPILNIDKHLEVLYLMPVGKLKQD